MLQTIITACLTLGYVPAPLLKQIDRTKVYTVTPYDVSWMNEDKKARARNCARKAGIKYEELR